MERGSIEEIDYYSMDESNTVTRESTTVRLDSRNGAPAPVVSGSTASDEAFQAQSDDVCDACCAAFVTAVCDSVGEIGCDPESRNVCEHAGFC